MPALTGLAWRLVATVSVFLTVGFWSGKGGARLDRKPHGQEEPLTVATQFQNGKVYRKVTLFGYWRDFVSFPTAQASEIT
jgi:hypothetical protein